MSNLKERLFAQERSMEAEAENRIVQQFDSEINAAAEAPEQFVAGVVSGLVNLAANDFLPRVAALATSAADQIAIEAGYTPK